MVMKILQKNKEVKKMPKGNPGGNPDVLMATAAAKKKDALERTEKAIAELVKSGKNITFKSVAEQAGVSVPYLYKYDELKERIQYLRNQQQQQARKQSKKPQSFQPASDQSKTVLIYNLREDNKKLRAEIEQHKRHIEVVQGRLYEVSKVKEENQRLKQQLNRVTSELEELQKHLANNPNERPKVTSIETKRKNNDRIEKDDFKSKISSLGIRINAQLYQIIESKNKEEVDNAISAVEEYISTGKKVKSKAGLFRKALEENWQPNLTDEEREISQTNEEFSEWFKLAKEQGLVQFSQGTKEGIIVMESNGEWITLQAAIDKGWTLEYLRKRNEK